MSADLKEPFGSSCCDGGGSSDNDRSCQPCGCDKGANWVCQRHREASVGDVYDAKDSDAFKIKDSGKRAQFSGGMVRDVTEGKTDTLLVRDGPMFWRWAQHLTNGAKKYAKRNWMLAAGNEEYERFKESAARHFEQWLRGDLDEDHAAAVYFNINGAEYVREKQRANS